MRRLLLVLPAALILFALGPTAARAASGVPYTIHGVDQATFEDVGICSPSATITLDARFVVHVNATEAGLTDQEILDALFNSDPEGILRSVTYTETGRFTDAESTGQVITGTFAMWFGGNINGHTMEFSDTFNVRGVDQNGNHVFAHDNGHITLISGEPVVDFEHLTSGGCP